MRSEQEMYDLILNTAREDERIRAVLLNGSRANPHAPPDIFRDYDIVYVVTDVKPFWHNLEWIQRFGEMMILQLPDEMEGVEPSPNGDFGYLMQFMDGNRIDLTIFPVDRCDQRVEDSLTVLLLDKDGIFTPFSPPDESSYIPAPPTAQAFGDCCNEFWWLSAYVAKGLWRAEIAFAKTMVDQWMRSELKKVLSWHIGLETRFRCSPGKEGKYFQQYLEPELWQMYLMTYADADYEHTWDALFVMGDLFRKVARRLAEQYGFAYPEGDDQRVSAHLKHVRALPKDAAEIY